MCVGKEGGRCKLSPTRGSDMQTKRRVFCFFYFRYHLSGVDFVPRKTYSIVGRNKSTHLFSFIGAKINGRMVKYNVFFFFFFDHFFLLFPLSTMGRFFFWRHDPPHLLPIGHTGQHSGIPAYRYLCTRICVDCRSVKTHSPWYGVLSLLHVGALKTRQSDLLNPGEERDQGNVCRATFLL